MWLCNDNMDLTPIEKCSQEKLRKYFTKRDRPSCLSKLFNMVLLCRNVIWKTTKRWYSSSSTTSSTPTSSFIFVCAGWLASFFPVGLTRNHRQTEAKHLDHLLKWHASFLTYCDLLFQRKVHRGRCAVKCELTCDQACHLSVSALISMPKSAANKRLFNVWKH